MGPEPMSRIFRRSVRFGIVYGKPRKYVREACRGAHVWVAAFARTRVRLQPAFLRTRLRSATVNRSGASRLHFILLACGLVRLRKLVDRLALGRHRNRT